MDNAELSNADSMGARAAAFTTTHWSVVLAARQQDAPQAQAALETLCRTYWYPLYAYLRRRGLAKPDAQDLIQGFFAVLLKRQALQKAEPGRGKFRSYLLAALNHFLIDEHDRNQAQKRGGGQPVISLDAQAAEQRYRFEPADLDTPEKLFDRRWAMTVIDNAMNRLEEAFAADGQASLFGRLRGYLVESRKGQRPYAEVAQQTGMSEEAVKKAVQRLRRRYREAIRQEIAQTVATRQEIEEELRHLVSVLSS